MQVVSLPRPTDQVSLPARCLVTGHREGVQRRATPVHVLGPPRRVELPVTRQGVARLVRRTRQAWIIVAMSVLGALAVGVVLLPLSLGGSLFSAVAVLALGIVAARRWRQRELHAALLRPDVVALRIPDPEAARELEALVQLARLPPEVEDEVEDAQLLGTMITEPREVDR